MVVLLLNLLFIFQVVLMIYVVLTFFPLEPGGFPSQVRSFLGNLFNPLVEFIGRFLPVNYRRWSMLVLFLIILIIQLVLQPLA